MSDPTIDQLQEELTQERKARLDVQTSLRRQRDQLTRVQAERDLLRVMVKEFKIDSFRDALKGAVATEAINVLAGPAFRTLRRELFAMVHYAGLRPTMESSEEWTIEDSLTWVDHSLPVPVAGGAK
jgi:hypothetical protein